MYIHTDFINGNQKRSRSNTETNDSDMGRCWSDVDVRHYSDHEVDD